MSLSYFLAETGWLVVTWIVIAALNLAIFYWVVRGAVLSALRRHREEVRLDEWEYQKELRRQLRKMDKKAQKHE